MNATTANSERRVAPPAGDDLHRRLRRLSTAVATFAVVLLVLGVGAIVGRNQGDAKKITPLNRPLANDVLMPAPPMPPPAEAAPEVPKWSEAPSRGRGDNTMPTAGASDGG